jgi:ubiquinone/menaquinone biosynthesis C-methylase UbiE
MTEGKSVVIQEFFDKTSSIYSYYFDKQNKSGRTYNFNKRLDLIKEISANLSGALLDCAVGDGQITAQVISSKQFSKVILVDISAKMLAIAEANCQAVISPEISIKTFNSDIYNFLESYDSNSCDLVICSGLIAHISDAAKLLQLLHRIISPNGRIILQSTLLDSLITAIVKKLTAKDYYDKNGYMIKYYKHQDILQICDQANLEVESCHKFSIGLQFLDNKLPPKLNYFLEKTLASLAKYIGTEAIYLIKPNIKE